jgi:predicted hotdog family 3-hydroxylacyl-ACP dehydratase
MTKMMEYSLSELLPHDYPMILLDRVIAYHETFIHAGVTIRKDSPFFEKGAVPSYVALEYMAQAIGLWNGLIVCQSDQKPQIGFLLGTRQLTLDIPSFKEGLELDIYGQLKYNDGEMASFDCWVEDQGRRAAQASLNVFQPKEDVWRKGV